jgi:hypothetical protein
MIAIKAEIGLDLGDETPIGFKLDDPIRGVLGNLEFVLGGTLFYDISNRLTSVSTRRGKSQALDRNDAGISSITLDNSDRTFDPLYPEGPYFGALVPRREIRISANDKPVFNGYIEDFGLEYQPGNRSTVRVDSADSFSILNNSIIEELDPPSELPGARVNRVLDLSEIGWPAELRDIENGDTLLLDSSVESASALSYLQTVSDSEFGNLFIGKDGSLVFRQRNSASGLTPDTYSVGPVVRTNLVPFSTIAANSSRFIFTLGTGGSQTTSWVTNPAYPSGLALRRTINTVSTSESSMGMAANLASSASVTAGQTYTGSVYVNSQYQFNGRIGLLWRNAANGLISAVGPSNITISADTLTRLDFTAVAPAGAVAVGIRLFYNTALATSGQYIEFSSHLVELSSALDSYFDGNTPDDSGPGFVYEWTGTAEASTSTSKILVSNNDGFFTFVTFSDDPSSLDPSQIPFSQVQAIYGSENLFTRVQLSNTDVIPEEVIVENETSSTLYGVRTYSATDLLVQEPVDLENLAKFLLINYQNPLYRFQSVTVVLDELDEAQTDLILNIEIGDIAQVRFQPSNVPPAIEVPARIIGISHEWDTGIRTVSFSLETLNLGVFVLDSPLLGQLDTDRLSY